MEQHDEDVVCIAFKRLSEGGYVALDSQNNPIKAFSSYQELEWDTVIGMRRVCANHPSDNVPKFMAETQHQQPPPLRDELPTQPARKGIAARVVDFASRSAR